MPLMISTNGPKIEREWEYAGEKSGTGLGARIELCRTEGKENGIGAVYVVTANPPPIEVLLKKSKPRARSLPVLAPKCRGRRGVDRKSKPVVKEVGIGLLGKEKLRV